MSSKELFAGNTSDITQSGRNGYIATPSDTEALPILSRQIRLLSDGDVEIVFAGYRDERDNQPTIADAILLENLPAGTELNYAIRYLGERTTAQVLVVY